jgi:hypothetical protein
MAMRKARGDTFSYPLWDQDNLHILIYRRTDPNRPVVKNSSFKTINSLSTEIIRRFGGQLDRLGSLRARWPRLVGEPIAGHSEPTCFEGGRLTITVRSPAWASRLRQQENGLVRALRAEPEFRALRDIKVRIEPTDPLAKPAPTPVRGPSRIPSQASRLVRSVAETVSDPQLRAALERLAALGDANK